MSDEKPAGILIPMDRLSPEALQGLIEEFILREGTDYGLSEYTLEQKHSQVLRQMKAGHVLIVFDPVEETTSLLRKEAVPKDLLEI